MSRARSGISELDRTRCYNWAFMVRLAPWFRAGRHAGEFILGLLGVKVVAPATILQPDPIGLVRLATPIDAPSDSHQIPLFLRLLRLPFVQKFIVGLFRSFELILEDVDLGLTHAVRSDADRLCFYAYLQSS